MSIEKCRENHAYMQTYLPLRKRRAVIGFLLGANALREACRRLLLWRYLALRSASRKTR